MNLPNVLNLKRFRSRLWPTCWLLVWITTGCTPNAIETTTENVASKRDRMVGHFVDSEKTDSLASELDRQASSGPISPSLSQNSESRRPASNSKSTTSDSRPPILAIQLRDTTAFGIPIGLFSDQTLMMRSDGAIQRIQNSEIIQQSILKDRFRAIDQAELSQQLRAEFGRAYLVRSESPYLIVARAEHMEIWRHRFKSLYHSFRLYCSTHGIATREIEFPLIAVVFGSHDEFLRYANSTQSKLPENCAGFYFSDSNRIALYESPDVSVQEIQASICHEATHQIAFNVGLHQRAAVTPLWIVEGLAGMFESPMFSGLQSRDGKSGWPTSRRSTWNALAKKPEALQRIVAGLIQNDSSFKNDTENAYCVAWAMTIYLSQRHSQLYGTYLQKNGNREPFQEYTTSQRLTDFENAFRADSRILTKKIISYLETLH